MELCRKYIFKMCKSQHGHVNKDGSIINKKISFKAKISYKKN